jgi:hypothetical protein
MADFVPLAPGIIPVNPHSATYHNYYQDDANDKAAGNYGIRLWFFLWLG